LGRRKRTDRPFLSLKACNVAGQPKKEETGGRSKEGGESTKPMTLFVPDIIGLGVH